jgi:hypothetical protein
MSNPCDFGMCDPEKCNEVDCIEEHPASDTVVLLTKINKKEFLKSRKKKNESKETNRG